MLPIRSYPGALSLPSRSFDVVAERPGGIGQLATLRPDQPYFSLCSFDRYIDDSFGPDRWILNRHDRDTEGRGDQSADRCQLAALEDEIRSESCGRAQFIENSSHPEVRMHTDERFVGRVRKLDRMQLRKAMISRNSQCQ